MKISIIGPTYPYRGGIAHYSTLLTQHLRSAGHDAQLLSYTRQYPRWLFPGSTDRDPSATPLQVACEYTLDPLDPRSWWRTARHIAQHEPDVVIMQWWVPYWAPSVIVIAWLVRRWTRAKIIFICHNVLPHEGDNRVRRLIARAVLRHGDTVIVHSAQDQQIAQQLLPGRLIKRTPHPTYGVFEHLSSTPEPEVIRQKLGLIDKQVLLFFGFVRPYKGLISLIDALPIVRRSVPNARLLVVGEFWGSKQPYLEHIAQLGITDAVTIVDRYVPNEEVGAYFAAADVAVLPYVSATQSGVAQLAFGFGVPVITTRVGGLHEAVAHDRTGLLVPPQDAQALAEAIIRFFRDDLGPSMRAAITAEQQEGRFDWERLVDMIQEG